MEFIEDIGVRPSTVVDPQGSRKQAGLSIDVSVTCSGDIDSDSNLDQSISPGPQIDERSPDARVYKASWTSEWLVRPEGKIPDRRCSLPASAEPTPSFNIWSIIKDFVGKDITHLSVPAHICEPTSELQRRAEAMRCSELLDQAADSPAYSRQRLLLVTAFAISIYSNLARATKPFKDLLHSTYELIYPEKGYRLIGEKVAHSPATTVLHCEGRRWRFLGYDEAHLEFSLQCYIRLKPVGVMSVTFSDGDVYEWNQVPIYIQGLVMGPINLDHKGVSQVICKANGSRTKLKVSCQGTFSRVWRGNCHRVAGTLVEGGQPVPGLEITGTWDQQISAKHPDGKTQVLWTAPPPPERQERFNFNEHAIVLNEILPGTSAKLPATDVRLRPDMQLLEEGYFAKASLVKDKLEDKQRSKRNATADQPVPVAGKWFECLPAQKEGDLPRWRYKGGYWEARESGTWPEMPDLYSLNLNQAEDLIGTAGVLSSKAREIVI